MKVIDANRNVVASYEYDPYGKIVAATNHRDSNYPNIAEINPLRYRSYYYDTDTGFYYLQSRYYDPAICRFINADSYASTGQGILGHNMFAYCGNNPISRRDVGGNWWDTVLDIISLGSSIADVVLNPTDFFAWAGLIGDIVDVVIPFVGGVGEVVDAMRVVEGFVEGTDDVIDAAKATTKLVSDSTGSYEIIYKSGRSYVGKGDFGRAITSATQKANKYGDEVASLTWKAAPDMRTAFIDEYISMCKHGGPNNRAIGNAQSYNKIWSPGRKYYYEDYGKYFEYDGKVW